MKNSRMKFYLWLLKEMFFLYFEGMRVIMRVDKKDIKQGNIILNVAITHLHGYGCFDRYEKYLKEYDRIIKDLRKEKERQINERNRQTAYKKP